MEQEDYDLGPLKLIWEWWDSLSTEDVEEADTFLEVLSDNTSASRVWLQIMIDYYGARFVKKALEFPRPPKIKELIK